MLYQLLKSPGGTPGPDETLRVAGVIAALLIPVRALLRRAVKIIMEN